MEVISCKSCKEVVSEQAESCPHCGSNIPKDGDSQSSFKKVVFLLTAIIVVAFLVKVGLMAIS